MENVLPLYLDETLPEPTGDEAEPQIYQNRIAAGSAWKDHDFPDYLSCHPKTWNEFMHEKTKESFKIVGTLYKDVAFTLPA